MYKRYERHEIDDVEWNQIVRASKSFRHYYLTYCLDNACAEWLGLIADDKSWVWPLPIKRVPIRRVFQPLLSQQLGPVGEKFPDEGILLSILTELKKEFASISIKFNDGLKSIPSKHITKGVNVELNLNHPYDQLYQNFNRNIRSNLKRAESNSLQISSFESFDPWAIDVFRSGKGKRIPELKNSYYKQVERLYRAFAAQGEAITYTARDEQGKCIAQVMLLISKNRILVLFTASSEKGKQSGAMHSIINEVIKSNSNRQMVLDFEGSNDKNLAYFYKSFGGSEQVYLHFRSTRLLWPFNRLLR